MGQAIETGRAFGLAVSSAVSIEGIETAQADDLPATTVRLGPLAPASDGRSALAEHRDAAGETVTRVTRSPDGAYLLEDADHGTFHVAGDGSEVVVDPGGRDERAWQRFLVGQALPLASVLRGREVLHASVVEIGGRAVAIAAPSGAGKSSIALRLSVLGAGLVADDVAALECSEGVLVHPGPGVIGVRTPELELLSEVQRDALGEPFQSDERSSRFTVAQAGAALPLAALYLLRRGVDGVAGEVRTAPPAHGDPRPLLASTFNLIVDTRARLARQLDCFSQLIGTARATWLDVPVGTSAAAVAEAIMAFEARAR